MISRKRCDVARQKCQKGRHRVQHRHAICFQKTGKLVGLAHHLGGRHEKARAGKVGKPDFLHRQIEGDGSALENDIARFNPVDFVGGAQIMANIAPRYHDALGRPGRTGRVDEIGGVLRARAERPRVDLRGVCERPGNRPEDRQKSKPGRMPQASRRKRRRSGCLWLRRLTGKRRRAQRGRPHRREARRRRSSRSRFARSELRGRAPSRGQRCGPDAAPLRKRPRARASAFASTSA